jgi:Zn-dependent metalloprotease
VWVNFNRNAKISQDQIEIIEKLKKIDSDLLVKWDQTADVPSLLSGRLSMKTDSVMPEVALGFLKEIKGLFRMSDPARELVKAAEAKDKAGNVTYAFQQAYNGIPVESGLVRVQFSADGYIYRVTNAYVPGINVDTNPKTDADNAIKSALDNVGPGWQAVDKPAALKIVGQVNGWHLAWRVAVDKDGRNPLVYYINADDGKPLYCTSGVFHGDGTGFYSGFKNLNTIVSGNKHKLVDTTRSNKIYIHDLPMPWEEIITDSGKKCAYLHLSSVDSSNVSGDDDDHWSATGPTRWDSQQPEVDLSYYIGHVADYFNSLGWKSIDGAGQEIHAGAHDGENFGWNSEYDDVNEKFYFGDGDGDTLVLDSKGQPYTNPDPQLASSPGDGKGMNFLTSEDIVAHEFTHGVICHSSRFDRCPEGFARQAGKCPKFVQCPSRKNGEFRYQKCGQSFTLHEAIADIFAYLITGEADSSKGVLIDREHTCVRTLNDPSRDIALSRHSNHMSADLDSLGKGYMDCHSIPQDRPFDPQMNMGLVCYAAYLLAEGGTHPNSQIMVEGIGRDKVGAILLHALTHELLTPSGNYSKTSFIELRDAMMDAAKAIFLNDPDCYKYVNSIRTAFLAVGIGSIVIFLRPRIMYDVRRLWFPFPKSPPDPRWPDRWNVRWPIEKIINEADVRTVSMKDFGDRPGIITLGTMPVAHVGPITELKADIEGLRGRKGDSAHIKLQNAGSEEGGAVVNLFACSPGDTAKPSEWKWVGSTVVQSLLPGAQVTAEVRIADKKILLDLDGAGEICLIAQIDSSGRMSPDRGGLRVPGYISLDSSEFICSKVKIN